MNLNSLTSKIRRLNQQLSTASSVVVLVLLIATSSVFYFICYSNMFYEQEDSLRSLLKDKMRRTKEIAMEVKIVELQKQMNNCQEEKKILATLIETQNNLVRHVNETLTNQTKLLEQEKNQTEQLIHNISRENNNRKNLTSNVTVIERDFFNYMAVSLQKTPYPGVDNYTRYAVARLGLLSLTGIEPLKPEYGPVINNVTSLRYPIAVPACQQTSANRTINQKQQSVFFAVISATGNFDKRNGIRQTWRTHLSNASYHNSSMVVAGFAFILGLTGSNETQIKIEEENKTHGDLIQIEMADFYRNLSLKVAGLFNWLYRHCHQRFDFLFKVDDDVYVNIRNLAQFVRFHNRSIQSIYGTSAGNLFPARDGKWDMSVEEWPWNDYPRYFYGNGVLFPGETILPFLAAFQTTPFHPIDDLYFSGICTEKAGVKIRWSTYRTSVFAYGLHAIPHPCDVRLTISWLTESGTHMNNSHLATEDFYHNRTQCVVAGSNGTNTTVDHNEPVHFYFE